MNRTKSKSRIENRESEIPDNYTPTKPEHLIGPARTIATNLLNSSLVTGHRSLRLMLHGTWGNGKTSILKMLARKLSPSASLSRHGWTDVESVNGKDVTIDVVRDWMEHSCYGSLFGDWKIKLIDEVDLMPQAAQELMLTFLDTLPPQLAVLASSNATLDTLSDRFVTRFSPVQVGNPTQSEIEKFLIKKFGVPKTAAAFIAVSAGGNVRDALRRATGYLIHGDLAVADRPKRIVVMKDPAKSDSAKRAWETMRAKGKAAA